jgi:hypothetical protein
VITVVASGAGGGEAAGGAAGGAGGAGRGLARHRFRARLSCASLRFCCLTKRFRAFADRCVRKNRRFAPFIPRWNFFSRLVSSAHVAAATASGTRAGAPAGKATSTASAATVSHDENRRTAKLSQQRLRSVNHPNGEYRHSPASRCESVQLEPDGKESGSRQPHLSWNRSRTACSASSSCFGPLDWHDTAGQRLGIAGVVRIALDRLLFGRDVQVDAKRASVSANALSRWLLA